MHLHTGSRLGPFEILSLLGAGGMGEVYKAKDSRLGRDVAIKVLPPSFADDPDRRARFEREAQAVAALSHPNVIAIFDTGLQAGQVYVVMELLAGETLRARLSTGALPVRKAVDIAVQIARGLGAAHGKGIVHRDLKPENIFVLDDGQVKILDFGLARQAASDHPGATRTMAATDPGTVMGTVGYMAPEQVRGHAVDARADVFAFGAVFYEMISGQRAYERDTAADTMTAILTQEPPELVGSRPDLSPAVDRIIRHCLEKNANERFQSARDIAFALEALSGTAISHPSGAVPVAPAGSARRRWLWPVLTAAAVIAAAVGGIFVERASHNDAADVQFQTKTWDSQWITNARFAPDGQTIIYSAARTGNIPSLFVIRPGDVASQPLAGPGTHLLSVSSKGELAVLTGARLTAGHRVYSGTLARMTMTGAARPWLERVSEADWSPDGSTMAVIRTENAVWQLEYPVGHVLYTLKSGYLSDPRVSPDGKQVAFFEHGLLGDDRGWVKVVEGSGTVRTLAGEYWGEEGIAWSADGGRLFFAAADGGQSTYSVISVNTSGTPRTRHAFNGATAVTVFDTAVDGQLLTIKEDLRASIRALVPGEAAEREFPWLDFAFGGFLSRDGKHLAFSDLSQTAGTNYAVAMRDTGDSPVVRVGEGFALDLSPDASWIAAVIPSTGQLVLYPTGPGEPIKLNQVSLTGSAGVLSWFSDSRRVLACGHAQGQPPRCYEIDIRGGASKPVTPDGFISALLADDDRTILASTTAGTFKILTIGGSDSTDAKGLTPTDVPLSWTTDRKSVIVSDKSVLPALIERVDLAIGQRTAIKTLSPPDTSGVNQVTPYQWFNDSRGYVYTYVRQLSQLLVVTGVRR